MIHYHGGPITPESCAARVWNGRHAFVSWYEDRQIELAASVSQSFALDNGAYSFWKNDEIPDWDDYIEWATHWLGHPSCDWAVIPDVIGGSEEENDELLLGWPLGHRGVPVWHLNESVDRLVRLAKVWPRIALGSADEFDVTRPAQAVGRLTVALPAISDHLGRPKVKLHGLRMLRPEIITKDPLASGDSTNIARNINIDKAWKGTYAPATKETRAAVMAERIESVQTPHNLDLIPLPL